MAYRYLSATKKVGKFADAGRYRSLICLDHYPPGVNFTMPHVQASQLTILVSVRFAPEAAVP